MKTYDIYFYSKGKIKDRLVVYEKYETLLKNIKDRVLVSELNNKTEVYYLDKYDLVKIVEIKAPYKEK